MTVTLIVIWFLLGVHSVYLLLNRLYLQYDEDIELSPTTISMMIISLCLPIATHLTTITTFPLTNKKKRKPLIIKKEVFKFTFLKKLFY